MKLNNFVKSQNYDGKVKSSKFKACEFRGIPLTRYPKGAYNRVRRNDNEMKRNAEVGLFTKPSILTRKEYHV